MQAHRFLKYTGVSGRHISLGWLCLAVMVMSAPVHAHRAQDAVNTSGLTIPNLAHDELRAVYRHKAAILDLASRQIRPDLTTRTLHNFVNLQFSYCLWGLVPGSLTDEASPFNGCSHAYLSASKALLEHLRAAADDPSQAVELANRIQSDLARERIGEICANGAARLNTAEITLPKLAGFDFNPLLTAVSLMAFFTLGGLLVGARVTGSGKASRNQ
ncbi:hypothetical protein [Hyphomicrobium sp.]|uniref:hypothetical protein n=1 Tax=Hyphomicrobium sp. TaxID=82 RepID=UPI002D7A0882|nr:hypothetical protein [Hyphomicrobium sp.]HET6388089.1 hypothetical protein [Hyphomicrobium sp.]